MTNIHENTPLYDVLLSFSKNRSVSFHVPGHKNGIIFHEKGKSVFNEILKIDATEIEGLDDLHAPEGPILEAQKLLSNLYNTRKSYFLINGSTCGNLAMIMATCREGDEVLVQRNCHKSILHGIMLAKAKPIFIQPHINQDWGTAEGITVPSLEQTILAYPRAKSLILTYPNYYGVGENIKELIEPAHMNGLTVLVDEAHGAHFIAGEPFLKSSLVYGADYVVQSAHKTLPAMTMGSYLHVNKHVTHYDRLEQYLKIFQSSSPSYPIMASLDLARSYLGTLTEADLTYTKTIITDFKNEVQKISGIKILQHQAESYDMLRITIQTDGTFSGYQLQAELQKHQIFCELADPRNILFILPILKNGEVFQYKQIVQSLQESIECLKKRNQPYNEPIHVGFEDEVFTELKISFAEMNDRKKEYVNFNEAENYIAAETITPYPPGIPYILNGEEITKTKIEYLQKIVALGAKFHGGSHIKNRKILVYV